MKSTSVFKPLYVLITSLVLVICVPQAFARGGGHGGGFGGGGFHGGGFGGFHGGGYSGWHGGGYGGWRGGGWGGYGWHNGYGWGGWRGWGPGWGWGFGVGLGWGWGWGSYWGGYPYAYGYPYSYYPYPYYYPYYPYYPDYYGRPSASAPQDQGPYNANPGGNSQQQNSSAPDWDNRPAGLVTTHATTAQPPASNRALVAGNGASYRTASLTTQQLAGLRPQARNVMRALLAMPPEARRRQVESGRYSNFSPEEQELFRKAAQLSAPATGLSTARWF